MNILSITSQTWIITLLGYSVVFLVLLTLIIAFGWLMPLVLKNLKKKPKKKATNENASSVATRDNDRDITAGESAAIAMALHLYLNGQHDEESNVITIKNIKRRYSPWSSKIHSMNNSLNRR